MFEGFLPARRLPGEFFELNPTGTALVGRRSGRRYRLGDPIEVRVESIARNEGKVELALRPRSRRPAPGAASAGAGARRPAADGRGRGGRAAAALAAQIRRRSAAQRVSSCREESWSLRSTLETWLSTVLIERCSRAAISL